MKKIVLITGASSGFGKSCAERFAAQGDTLILGARSVDKLEKIQQELSKSCDVYISYLDVQDRSSIEEFFDDLPQEYQNIDVLVNNAGLALGTTKIPQVSVDDWDTMINTNIRGLVMVTDKVVPRMYERNQGHIINIGSIAGTWPYPGGNVYGATKSFVKQFTHGLRADLLGKHIRVTNIEPGLAETNFSVIRMKGDQDKADKVYDGTDPLTGKDIAEIVWWVTSVPPHVNINAVEVMPTCQAWGPLPIDRTMKE